MNLNPIKRDTTIVETFGMEDLKVSHLFINFDYLKFKQFFFFFLFWVNSSETNYKLQHNRKNKKQVQAYGFDIMGTAILLRDRPHSTHLSSRDIIIHFKSDETPRSLIFP
jgi:hypothetical protein